MIIEVDLLKGGPGTPSVPPATSVPVITGYSFPDDNYLSPVITGTLDFNGTWRNQTTRAVVYVNITSASSNRVITKEVATVTNGTWSCRPSKNLPIDDYTVTAFGVIVKPTYGIASETSKSTNMRITGPIVNEPVLGTSFKKSVETDRKGRYRDVVVITWSALSGVETIGLTTNYQYQSNTSLPLKGSIQFRAIDPTGDFYCTLTSYGNSNTSKTFNFNLKNTIPPVPQLSINVKHSRYEALITWTTTDATEVTIDNRNYKRPPNGSITIRYGARAATLNFVATGPGGSISQQVKLGAASTK